MKKYQKWREYLLPRLRRGELTLTEAAFICGATKQAVAKWCHEAKIDVRAAREERLLKIRFEGLRYLAGLQPLRPSRSWKKAEAKKAQQDWIDAYGAELGKRS